MSPLISIIVPVYNANKHIARALASLIEQTYRNLEIIFVNDASTDDTLDIGTAVLEQSKAKYRIINLRKNSGVSAARNAGMEAATGEFITFLDGDDRLDENIISRLLKEASASTPPADITICGYTYVEKATGKETACTIDKSVTTETPPDLIAKKRILNKIEPALSVLYKSDFLRTYDITFSENCTNGEDVEFMTKALSVSKKTAVCHETGYFYSLHERMGSRNADPAVKMKRYRRNTEAIIRTADFILKNSASPTLAKLASSLLIPTGIIRDISYWAMKNDRAAFDRALSETDFSQLFQSRGCIREKPEVFLRALILYAFPGAYYKRYAKRYKQSAG